MRNDCDPVLRALGVSWEHCSHLTWQEDVDLDQVHTLPCVLGCSDPRTSNLGSEWELWS